MRVHLEDRAVCYLKSPLSQHYIIIIILLNYLNNAIQWPKPRNLPSLTGTTEAGELLAGLLLRCAPNGNGIPALVIIIAMRLTSRKRRSHARRHFEWQDPGLQ